jgi:predicted DNA-binding transcriptional regulator AlpA
MVKAERFPQPMKLTNKLPKWHKSEFYAWLESASTVATK